MKTRWSLVLCAAAMVCLCGCRKEQTIDTSSGAPREVRPAGMLVAQAHPYVADIPVPLGFELEEKRSRNYDIATARLVDHVYKGDADKFSVKRFYEEQMPINRWTLVTSMFVTGEVAMDFEKDSERCRVVVTEEGLFNNTVIRVTLVTVGQVPTRGSEGAVEKRLSK